MRKTAVNSHERPGDRRENGQELSSIRFREKPALYDNIVTRYELLGKVEPLNAIDYDGPWTVEALCSFWRAQQQSGMQVLITDQVHLL
jgi:hypothetical protein